MSVTKYLETGNKITKPLAATLFTQIRNDILTGDLRQGLKLTEQLVCDRYKASRTPVREAIRQLESDGLVQTYPNRGAYVVGFNRRDLDDLYVIKGNLDVLAAKWAAERIMEDEKESLTEAFDFMVFYTGTKDINSIANIRKAFLRIIYDACHDNMLRHQLNAYLDYITIADHQLFYSEYQLDEVLQDFHKIYDGCMSNDSGFAELAMKEYVEHEVERRDTLKRILF